MPGARVDLVEGGKGDFVVIADGATVWDKKRVEGRFPEPSEVLDRLRA